MPYAGRPAPGFVTTHDEFAISFSKEAHQKIAQFLATRTEAEARGIWKLSKQAESEQWSYPFARSELAKGSWEKAVIRILYRPFHVRWTVWNPNVTVHRRERIMQHLLPGENLALLVPRTVEISLGFQHVFCSRLPAQHHAVSTKEVNYVFPLYLYPPGLYRAERREANIAAGAIRILEQGLDLKWLADGRGDLCESFGPEDVCSYLYAILHSVSYRARYDEFMEDDFPRLPLTADRELFRELVIQGRRLIGAHLLDEVGEQLTLSFPQGGDDVIDRPYYEEPREGLPGRMYINKSQYLEGVPRAVAEYSIGGSVVAEKWVKDRRGRELSYDDLSYYKQILQAIATTTSAMEGIESAVDRQGGWPLR